MSLKVLSDLHFLLTRSGDLETAEKVRGQIGAQKQRHGTPMNAEIYTEILHSILGT